MVAGQACQRHRVLRDEVEHLGAELATLVRAGDSAAMAEPLAKLVELVDGA